MKGHFMSHCCWQNWLIKRLGYIYMMGALSKVYWTRVIHFSSDQTSFPCVTVAQIQSAVQAWKGSTSEDSREGNGIPLQYSCRKIPWTEEPGGLQSMGSLRVGHDWVTSLSLFTFMHWRRKWQPTPVFLPGESQGWGNLVGCHLWGHTESATTEVT